MEMNIGVSLKLIILSPPAANSINDSKVARRARQEVPGIRLQKMQLTLFLAGFLVSFPGM
jgi:hypothetical protein